MNKLNVLNVSDANKFAFIKGNRPTDEKAIKVKKDSISEHGILCPITAVNGEEVIKSNGHLTDLDGNILPMNMQRIITLFWTVSTV